MFTPVPNEQKLKLDDAIDECLRDMAGTRADSDAYARMMKRLKQLHALKEQETKRRVSPDTLAIVLGNIAVVLIVVGYEKANVVTSRALSFLQKATR